MDSGANPDAHIKLFKRAGQFVEGLKSSTEKGFPVRVLPVAKSDNKAENSDPLEGLEIEGYFEDIPEGDNTIEEAEKAMKKAKTTVQGVALTEVERTILEDLAKRNNLNLEALFKGAKSEDSLTETITETVAETVVEKAIELENFAEEIAKAETFAKMSQEVEFLKKSLALKDLEEVASQYEVLGKKKGELAETLYKMREVSEDVFTEFKKSLDEQLALLTKSGAFTETGSNMSGNVSGSALESKVGEIMKRDGATRAEAVVKAYEENPEIAMEYEKDYVGGGID